MVMVTKHSALEREQLRITGLRFDGVDRSAESRLRDEPREVADPAYDPDDDDDDDDWWDDGNLAAHALSHRTVTLGDGTVLDVWQHHADSGTAFAHGTTEVVAEMCQFQWMAPGLKGPSPLAEALDAALKKATAKKATAKKANAKKATAKKATAKKPAAKRPAAKRPAAKKPAHKGR